MIRLSHNIRRFAPALLAALLLTAAHAAAQAVKVVFAYPSGMNGVLPTAMEKASLAQKHGLDPTYQFFQYGPPMMEALVGGSVDVVITSLNPLTSFATKNPGAAVVTANLGASSHGLVVQPGSSAASLADLKGKTIAVSFNSDSHVDLLVSLHEAGLDAKSDVKLINIAPNELPSVFQTNQADAVVIREPQLLRLVEKTGGKVVQRWPFRFVAIARKGFLDANPGVAQKVFAALTDGAAYVTANPDEAAAWAGKNLRMDADFIKRVLEQEAAAVGGQPTDLAITPEFRQLLDAWAAKCLEHKLVKNKPEFGYAAVTAAK